MQHKGEILEKAIRESGHSITKLAQKMGKSRRWMYQIFDSANVPIDYIIDIGKIIHHDFIIQINWKLDCKQSMSKSNTPQVSLTQIVFGIKFIFVCIT